MGSISRRRFLTTTAAVAGATSLSAAIAACSSAPSASSNQVTIKYWDWWVSQAAWVDNEIKLFEKANPGIKVKKTTQAVNTYSNLVSLSYRSGNTPDVFMIPQQPVIQEQVSKEWFLPLNKYATTEWRSKFPENTFREGSNTFSGKTYSAPLTGQAPWLQLYINNKVFKDAGLVNSDGSVQLPKTWDDVTRAADAIHKKSGGKVYGFGFGNGAWNVLIWWIQLFTLGAGSPGGAYGMDYRTGKYTYASDRNYADFIELFLDWKKRGYIYPDAISIGDEIARAYFEQGKFGMTVGGVWNQSEWTSHKFTDYSLITVPSPSTSTQGYFYYSPGGTFIAISPKTKHADESWAWFDWIHSKEAGKRLVEAGIDISVFNENNKPESVKNQQFAQYVSTFKYSIPGPDPAIRNPAIANVAYTVKPDMGDVMVGLYTGQLKNVNDALQDLQKRAQDAFEKGVKQAQQQGHKVDLKDYIFSDWDPSKPYTNQA